jgi:hypothetical protein
MSSRKAMGEVRPDDNKIRIFGARRADGALGARETRVEGLALPNSVESGTLSVKKAGIRWMSVQTRKASHQRQYGARNSECSSLRVIREEFPSALLR